MDLNKFVYLLTVKRHFLDDSKVEHNANESVNVNADTGIQNYFSILYFKEQVALCEFQDLQKENSSCDLIGSESVTFKTINSEYYLISSRVSGTEIW